MAKKEQKSTPQNRTETGRFKKGVSGNPGGRPKKPVELELYAKDAPKKLRAIADDPDTPVKIKADIEKFFFEAVYGKAPQALDIEGKMENTGSTVIEFKGEIAEWAK
jgi:hypothetical protein